MGGILTGGNTRSYVQLLRLPSSKDAERSDRGQSSPTGTAVSLPSGGDRFDQKEAGRGVSVSGSETTREENEGGKMPPFQIRSEMESDEDSFCK